ncbi:ABC transporter ATP-binding protein [Bifidobacterium aesculapii]|uniref:ABC transporter ATP-binding protein n=1 Tax=Bifidobacterium aesculapii TaxID=1329411 RepID=UPI00278C55E1|nr:dipeptide/oligopeptide/nickel ABC transporter ATP-binding protein [Bifidobacterium aesculapii]
MPEAMRPSSQPSHLSSQPLLVARHIDASFTDRAAHRGLFSRGRRRQVLFDVSAEVRAGECLAVIGESGSGKTTLTRIMLGLMATDGGEIAYRGNAVARGSAGMRALRAESSIVFQDPYSSLDPRWTVERSVSEPLWLRRRALGYAFDEVGAKTVQALARVGLDPREFLNRYPCDLSGGQAQRVAIARAIVNEPKVILADEPMSAIDVAARVRILETLQSILHGGGVADGAAVDAGAGRLAAGSDDGNACRTRVVVKPENAVAAVAGNGRGGEDDGSREVRATAERPALIIVSHDLGVVRHIADRILVLHNGRVEESGTTVQVLGSPQSDYTRRLIAAASL